MTDDTLHFFCYAPQRQAVREELIRMGVRVGLSTVHGVDEYTSFQAMRGIRGGTFVHIVGHPAQPPGGLWDELRIDGFNIISFDDSRARAVAISRGIRP